MRTFVLALGVFLFTACQNAEEEIKTEEIVSDCQDVEVNDLFPLDSMVRDSVIIPETIIAYEIDDYYSHFFGSSVNDIKYNTSKEAFENGTFTLDTLNYAKGFIGFRTQNTPLDMDGDSETEYEYEITYWIQSDSSRIVAFCKSKYTYVDEESELTFFLHDRNGINKIEPEYANWTLNEFVDEDISSLFSASLVNNPPVYILLPLEGKEIEIHLALGEYYEPMDVYDKFDSLDLTINSLTLNPMEGEFNKIKAW